jgi:hypothetical protein
MRGREVVGIVEVVIGTSWAILIFINADIGNNNTYWLANPNERPYELG